MPNASFREIGDEKTLCVHDERNFNPVPDLTQYIPDDRIQQKLAELVFEWRNCLTLEGGSYPPYSFVQKSRRNGSLNLPDDPFPIRFISEKPIHA